MSLIAGRARCEGREHGAGEQRLVLGGSERVGELRRGGVEEEVGFEAL